ncbi:DNA polymerase III subunit beta [Thermogemmatispora carboxidivorans]|uniref:DNA polymerase III subunit beta n=1 Tax=Thermogemmatispora carboxidivorans TaxID=1382306 RepID=UPI0006998CCE|nr:DNA polymerase III subunit beta [Thermogemmatispora carboxidivorans]
MKFVTSIESLKRSVALASRAIDRRGPWPLADHLLLSAEAGGRVTVEATGFQLSLCAYLPAAQVQEEGQIAVPARPLREVLRSFPSSGFLTVEARLLDDKAIFSDASSSTGMCVTLQGSDPSEFPRLPTMPASPLRLQASQLRQAIQRIIFAAARDASRPALQGVLCQLGTTMTLVAADPFRLACTALPCVGKADETEAGQELLIPASALAELARLLPHAGTIEMGMLPSRVLFQTEQIALAARLLPDTYPAYKGILPKDPYPFRVVLEREPLLAQLKTAAVVAQESALIVRLRFEAFDAEEAESSGESGLPGKVVITTTADQLGETSSSLKARIEVKGLAFPAATEICCNILYLLEVLEALACSKVKQVAIEWITPSRPIVLRPVDSCEAAYLIMPMISSSPRTSSVPTHGGAEPGRSPSL